MDTDLVAVVHTFNPSIQESVAGGSLKFEVSLFYRVSSRIARDAERNLVLKKKLK